MKKLNILFIFLFAFQEIISQKQWLAMNTPGVWNRYDDIFFTNDSIAYSISYNVFKSTDYGKNWSSKFSPASQSRCIEFINDEIGFIGSLSELHYRTLDGGDTWLPIANPVFIGKRGICGMAHIDSTIFACGAYSGTPTFYRSDDLGLSWFQNRLDSLSYGLVDCHFFNKNRGLVSGMGSFRDKYGATILLTKDGGQTFKQVFLLQSLDSFALENYVWKFNFISDSIGFASIENRVNGRFYIAKTTDQGETWQAISSVISAPNHRIQGIYFENEMVGWIGGWFNGIYKTIDGGQNWNYIPMGRNINRFFKSPNGEVFASGQVIYKYDFIYPTYLNQIGGELFLNKFEIYPNPAKDKLLLKLSLIKESIVTIRVTSLDSKTCKEFLHKSFDKGDQILNFDISDFPSGSYIVTFLTDFNHESLPLIVLR